MNRFVLHELPREEGKCERSAVPVDGRVDVDGFQYGEQLSLLVLKRRKEGLASQWTSVVIVLSGPIHFSRRQRGIVDAAHTNNVPKLLAKWREAIADPMQYRCAARLFGRVRRKVPLVLRDGAHKIDGQAMEYFAVPNKVIDRHPAILATASELT